MSRVPIEERLRIVELSLKKHSQRAIAGITGRPLVTVNRIIQAYKKEGRLKDAPHRRRPRVTTNEEDHQLVAAVTLDPSQSTRDIRDALAIEASLPTLRRRLAEAGLAGLSCRVTAQEPLSESDKQDRLRFATAHESWTKGDWAKVIFSYESTFTTHWDKRLQVWRPVHCRYKEQFVQKVADSGCTTVNVWSAISPEGLGPLFRIDGSLTSDRYCTLLDHVMLPYALDGPFPDGDFVFQHDLSPVHTSRQVRALLEERCVAELPWPSKGADLNIIEHVWGRIRAVMTRRFLHRATTDELWSAVCGEWERLRGEPGFVIALYDSLPDRVRAVVTGNGEMTRY
uniref:Putative transposable element n=2 Tax=Ixodes ricinus TaxID=34613 RepID=A0A131XWY2_IXORI